MINDQDIHNKLKRRMHPLLGESIPSFENLWAKAAMQAGRKKPNRSWRMVPIAGGALLVVLLSFTFHLRGIKWGDSTVTAFHEMELQLPKSMPLEPLLSTSLSIHNFQSTPGLVSELMDPELRLQDFKVRSK